MIIDADIMSSLKDKLKEKYKIKDSIKDYKGYKVKSPEETIDTIETAFNKILLKVIYKPKDTQILTPYSPFQTGSAVLHPKENEDIALLETGGKGVSPILSRASATAELIERFTGYGLAQGGISHYLSYSKLNKIWIRRRKRNDKIAKIFPFHFMKTDIILPNEFENTFDSLAKSVCYSLTNDKFYLYPEEFITVIDGSNGLASGNTFEEATIHAISEVIERLVGFYVLTNLPEFNIISKESVTHPTLKKLISAAEGANFQFEMLDFSHVFGIPIIITIFSYPEWDLPINQYSDANCEFPKMIVGVDTDPQDAAMRCFTELFQTADQINIAIEKREHIQNKFLISKIDTSDNWKLYLRTTSSVFKNGNQPMLVDLRKYLRTSCKGKVTIQDIGRLYNINHKVEIKTVIEKLKKHNIEVFVHDITHPILKFPVVRAMFSGGDGYFSNLPFIGYKFLVLGADNKNERHSFLNHIIHTTYVDESGVFRKIIEDGEWCSSDDQSALIKCLIANLSFVGINPPLWGKNIDKFYFLGILYLKMGNYEQAKNCFNAALYRNFNDVPSLICLAHIYSKEGKEKEHYDVMCHINSINKKGIDVEKALEEMNNPVITPNPFEMCDFDCKSKNKPHLCQQCFFNYASEDVFMKDFVDDLAKH